MRITCTPTSMASGISLTASRREADLRTTTIKATRGATTATPSPGSRHKRYLLFRPMLGVPVHAHIAAQTATWSAVSLPRIDEGHAGRLEVGYIPGHDGHAMHKCGGCDIRISLGTRIGHMELGTTKCYNPSSIGSVRSENSGRTWWSIQVRSRAP